MKRRGITIAAAGVALLLSGCSSTQDDTSAALTDEEYYEAMQVGDFASMTNDQLDDVAKGLCGDLANQDADDRRAVVLLLRESVDTEQQAFEVGQAMTGRWCPEYVESFDY